MLYMLVWVIEVPVDGYPSAEGAVEEVGRQGVAVASDSPLPKSVKYLPPRFLNSLLKVCCSWV